MRDRLSIEEPPPPRVVIVGGGAAGVITATHLLQHAEEDHPVDVTIVEQAPEIGPGLAYRTEHPLHTLNNFAGRLSAIDGDPDHLLRWCADVGVPATPTSFLGRATYGQYLGDVLETSPVPAGSALRRMRGTVIDLEAGSTETTVRLSCGWSLGADAVVLALGNPPPRRQPGFEQLGNRYVDDPWTEDLAERVHGCDEVLLLGTGLTMVDIVAELSAACPTTRFTAVSRHGLLPEAHRRGSLRLHDIYNPGTTTLDTLIESVRSRIQEVEEVGGDWRDVVDSVRACANTLWQQLPAADQDWFVANLARHWEIARHRMSPDMANLIDRLRTQGTLRVATLDRADVSRFATVVNCTGPQPVPTRGWNPLVDSLLDRGAIRAHRLGLGLDLDLHGRVVDAQGHINPSTYVVGAARRGVEWEVAAIPDLRVQAAAVADRLLGAADQASPAARSGLPA